MCGHTTTLLNHVSSLHSKHTTCVPEDLNNNEKWCQPPDDEPVITDDSGESYWPNLEASILKNKLKFKDVSIECVVCQTDVTVFPHEHVVDEEVGESHKAVILPCGHIFGASCVKQFFDMKTQEGQPATCIKCRAACYHPACGHPFYGEPMPCSIPRMGFTPHVVGKGGSIDERCEQCTIQKAIADINAEVKRAPDRPETADEFSGVALEIDGISYTSLGCAAGERLGLLEQVPFPDSAVDFIVGYKDRLEEKENGQDYWVSGYLGQWGAKLYVPKQKD